MPGLEQLKKYRVELITFVVALSVSAGYISWSELTKPDLGLFRHLGMRAKVRHVETREVLVTGRTRRRAVERHLRRLQDEAYGVDWRTNGNAGGTSRGGEPAETYEARLNRLNGADLRHEDFSAAILPGIVLQNGNFEGASFQAAALYQGKLAGTRFAGANLDQVRAGRADFSGSDFTSATLTNADLTGANLQNANLAQCDLSGAILSGADCRGANFQDVVFNDATDFSNANLTGARNLSAPLRAHADSSGAQLTGPSTE